MLASARRRHRAPAAALLAPSLLAAVVIAALLMSIAAASGQGGLTRIGETPQLPGGTIGLGAAPSGAAVAGEVVLRPRDPRALEAFIARASSRGSAQFGHYLSPGQFAARFGPAPATVTAVREHLAGAGLRVSPTAGEPLLVRFSGDAAAAARAFATGIDSYRLAGGTSATATTSAPALPSSIASSVVSVLGLDQLGDSQPRRIGRTAAGAAHFGAARAATFRHPPGAPDACAAARADAAANGGLSDDQIAYAYGAFGLYGEGDTGAGVHIGVFEQEPFSRADIEHFDACYFGAQAAAKMSARLHVIALEGGIPQGPGSDGEALLDVEDVSGMAPGADIDVYEDPYTAAGEVNEIAAMVQEDRDRIVTSSYGQACEEEEQAGQPGTQEALNYLFQQGAAQGQTFLGAAGDSGSDNCEEAHRESTPQPGQNPLSGGEIASQPYVLGVGGTTITDATQPVQEHVWNDGNFGGAGGGGISEAFAMPTWQRDATVPGIDLPGSADYLNAASVEKRFGFPTEFCDDTLPAGTPCRLEPDVSAQSDEYTGAVTVYSEEYRGGSGPESSPDGWVTSGGTSSGTPIWAGMLALADASATCRENRSTASGVGFVAPLLYAIASNPAAYAASFNDITEGNNDQYGLDEGKVYPARAGFDLASGLGSPRLTGPGGAAGLAYYLCSYAAPGTGPTVTALSPASGSVDGGETVTVSGNGFKAGGVSDVAGVQVGVWHASPSTIRVRSATSLTITMPPARDTLPADSPAPQNGAGPADVLVTLADDRSSAPGPASTFQYLDNGVSGSAPGITGLDPAGGSELAPSQVSILGSGFTGATSVSFGGVPATQVSVLSQSRILATPPAYSSATRCAPLPSGGVYAGESATNDICQVQVVVHGPGGASATGRILPPFEGAPSYEQDGAQIAPAGCHCEVYPAVTEYDYAPPPAITSISTSAGAGSLADELGGSLVTIHGRGLNHFTLYYPDFQEPGAEPDLEQSIAFNTGTEMQISAPAIASSPQEATVQQASLELSVRTLAGRSAPTQVQYAGVPRVSAVRTVAGKVRLNGVGGAPDTGGAAIEVSGRGMQGQVTVVRFQDSVSAPSEGTNYTFTASSDSSLQTSTVAENPALANVLVCTVTGCSAESEHDLIYLYPPGAPEVASLNPHEGPAAGGTSVSVRGANLGCPLAVSFGGAQAQSFSGIEALTYCGSTSALQAVSPKGVAGTSVPVTVTTLESYFTGNGDAPSRALFTYTP